MIDLTCSELVGSLNLSNALRLIHIINFSSYLAILYRPVSNLW